MSSGLTDAVFLLSMSFAWATSAGHLVCAVPMAGDNDSATATLRTPAKSFFIVFVLSLMFSAMFSALDLPARLPTEPWVFLNSTRNVAGPVPCWLALFRLVN
jgi:hypothetical protein